MTWGPLPQAAQVGKVSIAGTPFQVAPGTYQLSRAETYITQVLPGATKYADFNQQYEFPWEAVSFSAGYGLRHYSDRTLEDTRRRAMYKESSNVDCREDGSVVLSPEITTVVLPAAPVWIGEYTPSAGALANTTQLVVIAGTSVYTVNADLTLTLQLTLPATPRKGAVGVFKDSAGTSGLIIGYGATRTGQFTTNLSTLSNVTDDNGAPNPMYIFAFTADRASNYIAGGANATDVNRVTSSTLAGTAYARAGTAGNVVCGTFDSEITSLAPGGGLVFVFVGKETELGAIDSTPNYRVLVPFDGGLSSNCAGMRWWLGAPGTEQRGPLVLFFPREYGLWSYQPDTQTSGVAQNISPWASIGVRPPNARGLVTAIQGSARWLYYAIENVAGETWVNVHDSRSGVHHTLFDLGLNACDALAISSLIGTEQRLYFGYGNALGLCILPKDGDAAVDYSGSRFSAEGYLDLPDIDFDLPDEIKVPLHLDVVTEGVAAGSQMIEVQVSYDGGGYSSLGYVTMSPKTKLTFEPLTMRRIGLRLIFTTTNSRYSPQLRGLVVRANVNPEVYRIWSFEIKTPAGSTMQLTDDGVRPYADVRRLWRLMEEGLPVSFIDRWNDTWNVRILDLKELETLSEVDKTPETRVAVQLLQIASIMTDAHGARYDDAMAIYDAEWALYAGSTAGASALGYDGIAYDSPSATYG